MQVSDYEASLSPKYLVFLELDTGYYHQDFKLVDKSNKEVLPKTFYLQVLNKDYEYIQQ